MHLNSNFQKAGNPKVGGPQTRASSWDRRSTRRCKIAQPIRVRPVIPQEERWDETCRTTSVSPTGFYYRSKDPRYELGMRLFISTPRADGAGDEIQEYLAEVVRCHSLSNGLFGIGLKILTPFNFLRV